MDDIRRRFAEILGSYDINCSMDSVVNDLVEAVSDRLRDLNEQIEGLEEYARQLEDDLGV